MLRECLGERFETGAGGEGLPRLGALEGLKGDGGGAALGERSSPHRS